MKIVYLDFLTFPHVLILWDGVGHNHSLEAGIVDSEKKKQLNKLGCFRCFKNNSLAYKMTSKISP